MRFQGTYGGGDDMYMQKNSLLNKYTCFWYIRCGNNNDHLNDIAVFHDGAFAFSG